MGYVKIHTASPNFMQEKWKQMEKTATCFVVCVKDWDLFTTAA